MCEMKPEEVQALAEAWAAGEAERKAKDSARCCAVIYKRDDYRYSGRGSSGFTMSYSEERCSRATKEDGLCGQHLSMKRKGASVRRWT